MECPHFPPPVPQYTFYFRLLQDPSALLWWLKLYHDQGKDKRHSPILLNCQRIMPREWPESPLPRFATSGDPSKDNVLTGEPEMPDPLQRIVRHSGLAGGGMGSCTQMPVLRVEQARIASAKLAARIAGMQPLNVGIIGFGRIGAQHANWLGSCKSIRASAAADATPARQDLARSRGLKVYSQIDPLLADASIDAILISTPTAMHFDHVQQALSAGKHVLVEKPMALDFDQARRMAQLAEQQRRVLSVFHNRRWDIDYLTVAKHIGDGVFGRIINIESRLGQWASCVGPAAREYRPGWRNEAAFGGGCLYDWGSHFLDQLWHLMWPARPLRVFAQLRGNVWTRDCDDFARVCIDFDNGAVGMVEINTTTTRPLPRWHIDGTNGSAQSPFSLEFDTQQWAKLEFSPGDESGVKPLETAEAGLTEVQIWERFASAIRGEGKPAVPVSSVLGTMALLDAARKSSQRGTTIDVSGVAWEL